VPPVLVGDYNLDGIVDAGDYNIWRDAFGSTEQLAADGNRDGTVDTADYELWRQNFGRTLDDLGAGQSTSTVPEPAIFHTVLTLVALAALRRFRIMREV
jgi:hypothetical protein